MTDEKSVASLPPPHEATNAWLAVVKAHNICGRSIAAQIAPAGLNLMQHEILINLLLRPGQSQQELANRCFSAKSGISAMVSAFEERGMITRQPSEEDARKKLLFLTNSGHEQAEANYAIQNEIVADIASKFSARETEQLENNMNEVSDFLKAKYL